MNNQKELTKYFEKINTFGNIYVTGGNFQFRFKNCNIQYSHNDTSLYIQDSNSYITMNHDTIKNVSILELNLYIDLL